MIALWHCYLINSYVFCNSSILIAIIKYVYMHNNGDLHINLIFLLYDLHRTQLLLLNKIVTGFAKTVPIGTTVEIHFMA